MIQKFIDRFNANYKVLENKYKESHPESYKEIVKDVVSIIGDSEEYHTPSAERIVEIDHGDYQGNLLYVIGDSGYQPSDYWYVMVSYGSCPCCDMLQGIQYGDNYSVGETPTETQVNDYMRLALHIVQCIRKMYPNKDE